MKHYYKLLTITVLLTLSIQMSFSQNTDKYWSFEVGVSAVDLYPVGEDTPQGDYFDEFVNLNDHWNLGVYIGATRNFSKNLSITARGTINEISKWGEFGEVDESVLVDNLKHFGLDGMINYSFGQNKLQPFIAIGGGYTWIEEGPFNTFSNTEGTNNLVGAGTVNGSLGLKYWVNDNLGLNLQTTYKHVFEDYLPKHWEHNLGVVYKLRKVKKEEETNDSDSDRDGDGVPNEYDLCPDLAGIAKLGGCQDSDGDGISDKDDLCPSIKGSKEFGGCKDSDGDGVPDNRDNCPGKKGADNGCPLKVDNVVTTDATTTAVIQTLGKREVYFNYNSAKLDLNTKTLLNELATSFTDDSRFNISIEGHADNKGRSAYNYDLSVARANVIKDYLISKGATNATILTKGKGETEPVASNNSRDGRAENRRSIITINVISK